MHKNCIKVIVTTTLTEKGELTIKAESKFTYKTKSKIKNKKALKNAFLQRFSGKDT